jgi:dephospho-CoA kinase
MSKVVALTGGIGSGKSTVSQMLEQLGATVIDADAIVHELQGPGMPMLAELVDAFGPEIVGSDGALLREELGRIIFSSEAARERLNALVHPKVGAEFARRLVAAKKDRVPLIVLDIPLLFEGRKAGSRSAASMQTEAVVVVWAPRATQLERQMARDERAREDAQARIDSQIPIDEKRAQADHVIDNSGSRAETEQQVAALYAELTGEPPKTASPR